MRKIITFLLSVLSVYSFGQYADSFSDGDFSVNPAWSGNGEKFIVNSSKQLQLQAPAVTSTAYLSTPSMAINDATWQFSLKANLLLTSANYLNYYLVSDNADLGGSLNGYYVMVGNTGKEVALYRQTGAAKMKLIAGSSQRLPASGSVSEIIVKVLRDDRGNWVLYSKLPSESAFVKEGAVTDTTYVKSTYSGIFCNYSSTNSAKYYFDDFVVTGDPFRDKIPPAITSYSLSGESELIVNFSEPVTLDHAVITVPPALKGYTLSLSETVLKFSFPISVPRFQQHVLTLEGVADLDGNLLPKSDLSFGLFPAGFGDLVINEIMCDPSPVVGLPDVEYIELYNKRDFTIDLSGWKLYYGTKAYPISAGKVTAGGYLLLGSVSAVVALRKYGDVASMSSFPALSSTEQLLYLTNEKDSLIAFVNYSDRWYKDDFKKTGGWSLECIDSDNMSGSDANWTASVDRSGGTPGRVNSVVAKVQDTDVPRLMHVSLSTPDTLLVQFDKSLLLSDLSDMSKYAVTGNLSLRKIDVDYPKGKWVRLLLSPAPQRGVSYVLSADGLRDVNGLLVTGDVRFGVSDSCEYGDIVINEVLSHPKAGGSVFVELFNRSDKIIDLKNIWLNRRKPDETLDAGFAIASLGTQLFPKEYIVLTPQKSGVCAFYSCNPDSRWMEMSNFVSLPNASGNVMLINRQGDVIDEVDYDEKRHDFAIKDPAGVSFERVNPDWDSNSRENWRSCASDAGYATPGYLNSQFYELGAAESQKTFWLERDVFTPDNDGDSDFLTIRYKMPENGYSATIAIYNAGGHRVKQIADNSLLGIDGHFIWNGYDEDGKLLPSGIYIVYTDAVLPSKGIRSTTKIACIITGK